MSRQLHSIDRLFLDMETKDFSMGVTPLYFYDPANMQGGTFSFAAVLAHMAAVARSIPVLCGKLHRVALDIDNPYLVADQNFSIENHVKHLTMTDPTNIKELSKLINDFHQKVITIDGPLWEAVIVSGVNVKSLPDNAFVIAIKIHHAIADGASIIDMTRKLHGDIAIGEPVKLPGVSSFTSGGLLGIATRILSNNVKQTLQLIDPLVKVGPQLTAKALNFMIDNLSLNIKPALKTRFSGEVSENRVWGYTSFKLNDLKVIKNRLPSSTINDVVCTIISGAMREYLLDKNEMPDGAIKAMAPVNIRSEQLQSNAGNEISLMAMELPVHIEDPLTQLVEFNKGTSATKAMQKKVAPKDLANIAKNLPPMYLSVLTRLTGPASRSKLMSLLGNITITNVPGPVQEFNMLGAKLVNFSAIAPIMDNLGLIFAVSSYNGQLNVSVTCCEEMIPDIKYFIECIDNSYQRLKVSALGNPSQQRLENDKATINNAAVPVA